jgi:3-phytase
LITSVGVKRLILCASVAFLLAGCGGRHARARPAPAATRPVDFLASFVVPAKAAVERLSAARFGGISGLATDSSTGELLGICDDEGEPRVFVFRTDTASRPFRVDLTAYFPLPSGSGAPAALDPEAIAITRGGRLFVASEGLANRDPAVPPAIVEYSRRVEYIGQLRVPEKFLPSSGRSRGVRPNAAFESLTLSPDERHLFTGTETALVQDGEPADWRHGTLARILEYESRDGAFQPGREFAYPIEPLRQPPFTPGFFINGLVEMVALSDTVLLAMERGYAEEPGGNGRTMNQIRIFRLSLDGATDISGIDSLRAREDVRPVRKTLLLDLDELSGLGPELEGLDNFEGMALGPAGSDGSRTLLLVSDDNFSPKQHTAFLLFRLASSASR